MTMNSDGTITIDDELVQAGKYVVYDAYANAGNKISKDVELYGFQTKMLAPFGHSYTQS